MGQEGAPRLKKTLEKITFFYFKQKKETRRKEINASQLAVRNLNNVTGKHLKTPAFYFYVVFLEAKKYQAEIWGKEKKNETNN